mgnify:FL=1|tara:strand:- start:12504 stop:12803 length:300 start_codon:yes stop_codon:yes gene_type:complete
MKIDKGIPIQSRGEFACNSKYAFVMKMDYGDSVQTDNDTEKQGISLAIRASDSYCKAVTRSYKDDNGKKSWRIWKVKLDYGKTRTCMGCGQLVTGKKDS